MEVKVVDSIMRMNKNIDSITSYFDLFGQLFDLNITIVLQFPNHILIVLVQKLPILANALQGQHSDVGGLVRKQRTNDLGISWLPSWRHVVHCLIYYVDHPLSDQVRNVLLGLYDFWEEEFLAPILRRFLHHLDDDSWGFEPDCFYSALHFPDEKIDNEGTVEFLLGDDVSKNFESCDFESPVLGC